MDKDKADRALFEFADIAAEELGVTWFLALGTCLGFVRSGGYIPGDTDIDLGIICGKEAIIGLFRRLVQHGFRQEYTFLNPGNEVNQHFLKYETLLDIFFIFLEKERQYLDSFDEVEYEHRKFKIPHPIEDYLACEFGDDWRTPSPEKSRGLGSKKTNLMDALRLIT